MTQNNIGFDLDGVLCHTSPWLSRGLHELTGEWVKDIFIDGNRSFEYELSDKIPNVKTLVSMIEYSIAKYQHLMYPFDNADLKIAEFKERFKKMPVIVSARNPKLYNLTKIWCDNVFGECDLHLVHGFVDKADKLQKLGIEYYIDDRYKTSQVLAVSIKHSYLLNQPYNMGRTMQLPNVIRVDYLEQMFDHIEKLMP